MSWLYVFFGGGLGAMARYGLSLALPRGPGGFPYATLCVNILGSFLIGLLLAQAMSQATSQATSQMLARPEARLFLAVGLLGGFTTFSALSFEVIQLFQARAVTQAVAYVLMSIVLGLGACWLGMKAAGHA